MKRSLLRAALALAVALAAASAPAAEVFVVDKVHSDVSFQVRHFVSKVRGRFTDFDGIIVADRARPEASTVEFRVKTASIDTDNDRRDGHLRSADFFEAEKYPEITFKSTRIVPRGGDRFDVTGVLAIHGVAREITIPVTFQGLAGTGPNAKAGFETIATINRKDYGIVWNRDMDGGGFVLGDDVLVSINIEAVPRKEPSPPPPAPGN
jgi:polyisoprenoid-binding protein YceI